MEKQFQFSYTFAIFSNILVFLNTIHSFIRKELSFFPIGISFIIFCLFLFLDDLYIESLIKNMYLSKIVKLIFLPLIFIIYYIAAIRELINLFYFIPFHTQHFLLFPFLIFLVLLTGSVVGVFQKALSFIL